MSFSQQANITARICGPKLRGIEVNMPKNKETSVSVSEGTANISTYLQPYVCAVSPLFCFIEATIIKPDRSPYFCKAESKDVLRWEYIVTFGRVDGIKIFFWHPPDACDWESTLVQGLFKGPILLSTPNVGEIIAGKDAYPHDDNERSTGMLVNDLRPGEPISLTWRRKFVPEPIIAGSSFFHGYNITGGRILAILSAEQDDERFYSVSVEGSVYSLPATDFYPYEIDDWVCIIFKTNDDTVEPGRELSDATAAFITPFVSWYFF